MIKKYAPYILLGMLIGAFFGTAFGSAIGNMALATALGAVGGVFIGWFIAAAIRENETPGKQPVKEKTLTKNEIFFFTMIVSIAVLGSLLIIVQPDRLFK